MSQPAHHCQASNCPAGTLPTSISVRALRTLKSLAAIAIVILSCLIVCSTTSMAQAGEASDTFKLASAHYQRGQWKQSIENFELLITQFPNHPDRLTALFFLGEALVQQEQYIDAGRRYAQFIDEDNQSEAVHQFRKRAEFRMGESAFLDENFEVAREHLADFYRDYPEDELLEYALPYLGQLEIDRAEMTSNDIARGTAHFELALQRFPDGVLADECRFGLGIALADTEPEQSVRFLRHVTKHGKDSLADDAALELGRLLFRQGKYSNAAETLSEFETRFISSELLDEGLYWYGRALARSDQFNEARRVLNIVMKSKPADDFAPSVWFEAAIVSRQLDDRDESSRLLAQLVKRWPDSEWNDESLLILAQNEYQAERFELVVGHAEQLNADFPLSEFRQNMLELQGKSLLSLEQNDAANAVFRELIELSDGLPVTKAKLGTWHYLLGLGLFRMEKADEAIAAFDEAARNSTNDSLQAAVNLARSTIFLDRKEYDAAVSSLVAYLTVTTAGEARNQVRAELARVYAISNRISDAAEIMLELQAEPNAKRIVRQLASNLAEYAYRSGEFELSLEWFYLLLDKQDVEQSESIPLDEESIARGISGVAWSQVALGRIEDALKTFSTLIDSYPGSCLTDEAILKRGILEAELNRTEQAIKTLCLFESKYRASKLWPEAVLNLVRITNKSGQQEHLSIAAEQIEKLMAANIELKADDEFLYQLAWLQNDLGDSKSSESTFRKISHRHRSSKYWADASYRVAEIAVHENRLDEAKLILNQLINSDVDSTDIAVHGLYLQGKIAVDQQDWNSVEKLMSQLVNEHPDHKLALTGRFWQAEAAYRTGKFDVAMQRFDELHTRLQKQTNELELQETYAAIAPGLLLRRAQLWARKDAWHLARKLADQFVLEYPTHATRHEADYIIGRSHAREGEFSYARGAFERVLDYSPARGTETAAMAQFMIGEACFHQEKYDEAIKAYHKAEILHAYPQWQSASLLQGGKCYELIEQWHDAIVCYQRVLDSFESTEYAAEAAKRLTNAKNMAVK